MIVSAENVLSAPGSVNDQFAYSMTVTGTTFTVSSNNDRASKEPGEPNHANNPGGRSVWWSWTAPGAGEVQINSDGSNFDTLLAVYTGSEVSALTAVASNDDHGELSTSRVKFETLEGVVYRIAVDGFNSGSIIESGNITLSLMYQKGPIPRPPNDNFTNRFVLTETNQIASNVNATREPGEPMHLNQFGDTSIWWTWTAPKTGRYRISTEGSSFDTVLMVYTGTNLSSLIMVTGNDDVDSSGGILTSTAFFTAIGGRKYQVAVDGFDGASGEVKLCVQSEDVQLRSLVRLLTGAVQFVIFGAAGQTNQVQASEDLRSWLPIGVVIMTNTTEPFTDLGASNKLHRVYRALKR